MAFDSSRQRTLLWSFITSIVLCAITGIYCLLLDAWGPLQERILGTTATIALASVLALASTIPWERRIWHPIGPVGCVAAGVAATMLLLSIWSDIDQRDMYGRTEVAVISLAVALPIIGLLGLARLRPAYAWVRAAGVVAVAAFEAMLLVAIYFDPDVGWWERAMGIVAILSVSGVIATPILHRISALPGGDRMPETSDRLSLTCPRCGAVQTLPLGRSNCGECGLGFRIEVGSSEPRPT